MGRLVINHSTNLEGLIKRLKKLSKNDQIRTITPGVISKAKGRSNKFNIRITTEIAGGYKLLARKGFSVQEIFIITKIKKQELEYEIEKLD